MTGASKYKKERVFFFFSIDFSQEKIESKVEKMSITAKIRLFTLFSPFFFNPLYNARGVMSTISQKMLKITDVSDYTAINYYFIIILFYLPIYKADFL